MISKITTFGLSGTRAFRVTVETDISKGIPYFEVVGLGSETVRESRKRVRAAILNRGLSFPPGKVTLNLSPADVRKIGTGFDLPIAAGIIFAGEGQPPFSVDRGVIGEMSLDGSLVPVKGVLPSVVCGKEQGITNFIVPAENYGEACLCPGINVFPAKDLNEALASLKLPDKEFREKCEKIRAAEMTGGGIAGQCDTDREFYDFCDVYGQEGAKRALEIAAAGKHNVVMSGSPGCGKTLLAKCFAGILPEMSFDEYFQVMQIYSSCGIPFDGGRSFKRPFRTIHHGITRSALIGGGRPLEIGEVSLAHNGVLFFDELSETPKSVVESLRQPLEDGKVYVSNYGVREVIPADFILIGAMNPCPCGNLYEKSGRCTCTQAAVSAYASRVSGAILDRIDIKIKMRSVEGGEIGERSGDTSSVIRERVRKAREIQRERYKGTGILTNGDVDNVSFVKACEITGTSRKILEKATDTLGISVRSYGKIVKVARTIADLDGRESIDDGDILESLSYRGGDEEGGNERF